jgi:CDP-diacylglycerol---serine O-phosphatidyltransferase
MAIVIMILVTVFSLLLVSEIPMFSLKFKNYALKSNFRQYLLIVLCIVFIITLGWTGIAATILAYILLSVLTYGK